MKISSKYNVTQDWNERTNVSDDEAAIKILDVAGWNQSKNYPTLYQF